MAAKSELQVEVKATDKASPALKQIGINAKQLEKDFKKIGIGMMAVGTAIVGGAALAVTSWASMGEQLVNLSTTTGISVEELSKWKYICESMGVPLETYTMGIKNMQKSLVDASTATDTSSTSIGQLGIDIGTLMKQKPDEQFQTISTALQSIDDKSKQIDLMTSIFGKSAIDLGPAVLATKDEIILLKDAAVALNVVMSDETAVKAAGLDTVFDDLKTSFIGMKNNIAEALAPVFGEFATKITSIVTKIGDWAKANPELVSTILKVGVALIGVGGLLFAFAKIVAVIKEVRLALITMQSLMGPVGWANLLAGVAAAGVAISAYKAIESVTSEGGVPEFTAPTHITATQGTPEWFKQVQALGEAQGLYQHGGTVPGRRGQPIPIIAHGGERFAGVNNSYMGGMGSPSINVTVQGSVISERNLVNVLRDEFIKIKNRNTSTGFA